MGIKNFGKGGGQKFHWRNATQHGTVNLGDVDFSAAGLFAGMSERRSALLDYLYEANPDGTPRTTPTGERIKAATKAGFDVFKIGAICPRIGPGATWTDEAAAIPGMNTHRNRRLVTWIAFADTPEGRAEFEKILNQNEALHETKFDHVFVDPRVIDGKQKTIRRFGFADCTMFLTDVSDKYDDINSGRIDPVVAHHAVEELATVKKASAAKDLELEALRAKIAEHEAKLSGGGPKLPTLEDELGLPATGGKKK